MYRRLLGKRLSDNWWLAKGSAFAGRIAGRSEQKVFSFSFSKRGTRHVGKSLGVGIDEEKKVASNRRAKLAKRYWRIMGTVKMMMVPALFAQSKRESQRAGADARTYGTTC